MTVGVAAVIASGYAISQQNDAPSAPPAISSELARRQAETARLQGMADALAKSAQEAEALEEAVANGIVPAQTLEPVQSESAREAEALRDAIARGLVPDQALSPGFVEKPGQPR